MNYELAKQLKDAGYPQRETGNVKGFPGYVGYGLGFLYNYNNEEPVYAPTLSELIEMCGDRFGELVFDKEEYKCYPKKPWENDIYASDTKNGWYSTPTESAAMLWLYTKQYIDNLNK